MAGQGQEFESGGGITRREALKRGTMAGFGLVWIAPTVDSFKISAQTAQPTSPVPETLDKTEESANTTEAQTSPTDGSGAEVETSTEATVRETNQPEANSGSEVETDVLSDSAEAETDDRTDQVTAAVEVGSGQLPLTGLGVEQLLPIAGGAVATGAAAVRLARDRKGDQTEVAAEPGENGT